MNAPRGLLVVACVLSLLGSVRAAAAEDAVRRYRISEYGAVGDDRTINTGAIQALIDRSAEEGGGLIVVPKGTFRSGALFFRQGVALHLEKDGVLKGTTDPNDYPIVHTRWEGEEREWVSAFINFRELHDVRVTGEGTIDGAGDEWVDQNPRRRPSSAGAGTPAGPAAVANAARGLPAYARPRLIGFENCRNVLVSDLNLKNEASWGLYALYCEDVVIRNLTIRARHDIPSSDGIDVDSSKRVRIAGCDIDVNDDCISIKSGKDEDGRRVNRPAEEIVVEECHFRYGHGGVAMGSEMSGGIRNVEVRDCVMDSSNWAPIRFKSQPSRGGVVEDITYRNIELNGTRKAFEFNLAWRMVNPKPPADPLPVVRDIHIINVSGTVRAAGDMSGLEGSPIRDVRFENCHLKAQRPLQLRHVEAIDLDGLHIEVPQGPSIVWE